MSLGGFVPGPIGRFGGGEAGPAGSATTVPSDVLHRRRFLDRFLEQPRQRLRLLREARADP